MYLDTTKTKYVELLNKKCVAHALIIVFHKQGEPQGTIVNHDKKAELLDNLKHSECKRGNLAKQGGGIPPICFIHPKANLNKEAATATIYTLHEVKEEFLKYSSGITKLAIMHVWLFKLIIDKCIFVKNRKLHSSLLTHSSWSTKLLTRALVPVARSSSRTSTRPGRR